MNRKENCILKHICEMILLFIYLQSDQLNVKSRGNRIAFLGREPGDGVPLEWRE